MGYYRFLTFFFLASIAMASPGALPVAVVTCNASPIPTCIAVNFAIINFPTATPTFTFTPTGSPTPTPTSTFGIGNVNVTNWATPDVTKVSGKDIQLTAIAIQTANYPAPLYYTPTPTFTPTSTPAYVFIQYSLGAASVTPTPVSTAVAGHFHSLFLTLSSNQASATNFILFNGGNAVTLAGYANGVQQIFFPDFVGNKATSITGMNGNTTVNLSGWMVDTVYPPHPGLGFPWP